MSLVYFGRQWRCKQFPVCSFILEDFQKFHIDVSLVSEHAQCVLPASVVISNSTTGSRTILHMNRFVSNSLLFQEHHHRRCHGAAPRPLLFHQSEHSFLCVFGFYFEGQSWCVSCLCGSVSSWLISWAMMSMSRPCSGKTKVKLRVHVAWFARPLDLAPSFSQTCKTPSCMTSGSVHQIPPNQSHFVTMEIDGVSPPLKIKSTL